MWDWHGDFVDQGLLYYWTIYYKQDVSIVINDEIENWASKSVATNGTNATWNSSTTSTLVLDRTLRRLLEQHSCERSKLKDALRNRWMTQINERCAIPRLFSFHRSIQALVERNAEGNELG
jgi:hypothetical protein